jgi:hypothetical protein
VHLTFRQGIAHISKKSKEEAMKSLRSSVFLLLTMLLAVGSLPALVQNSENFPTVDAVQAVVERHHGLTEDLTEDLFPGRNIVHVVARHADGTVFYDETTHNLRTTGGTDWQGNAMAATSARPAAANYIALTNDGTAPAVEDCAAGSAACTLTSEIGVGGGGNGLARAQATYAHVNGNRVPWRGSSYTLTNTFTATGDQMAQKSAVFNAASSGTMVYEALFPLVSLISGETVTIDWTIWI